MTWLPLTDLLLAAQPERQVALYPALNHAALREHALRLAAALQARGVQRVALYLEDAAELAIALLGAWRAGVQVLLPADAQVQTRQRLSAQVDLWLDDLTELDAEPLPGARLLPEHCRVTLCTSGSSGEPKLIDKSLAQLANEVEALERLWGQNLGQATILGSVACQHIYGLLFRLLWPLCAGRPVYRRALPFPEDLQQASLAIARGSASVASAVACTAPGFAWVASPALLKRMGDNLDWSALSCVKQVFSSGGALPSEAAESLHERLGQWPTEIYGSSETGGIGWRQGDTAWQPFPGVELSLDETGALRIASPYLPAGHIEQSADAAEIGADGRFVLRGRLDRIIKLEEKRISLPMLEQALISHDWVTDARLGVIQEGRAFLGAVLALSPNGVHVLRNQGRRSVTETLRRHLAEHCETIALPRRWRLLLELPYSSQGKLAQSQIDALLAAPRPTRVEPVSAEQRDGEWLLQLQVPLDLAHFTGHFPQTPVLPGVVQVDWAQQLARQLIIDLPPRFAGMEVLKFQQLVRPGDTLQLSLRFDAERGKLYFAYRNGEAACSSGRILLEPAHG
ncbi:acyl-CoA synthetase family protein [Pseudomonas chengduensis]|uniref:Acyl-coenzyme A synthetase/AMP-(Fatty) acid ligase n=1 Tax=Ectopseudomonas chengduensis TaxID=489632 RepID=A0A1G6JNE2_9GAMM|nr:MULTISPECIES: acyl-CoA synthetase family protein [Pseudomonas]KQO44359.1 AMP-binding protein [Pseudomonas sp. Leaf83]MBP3060333.1 AMP-binding protein [Pseudomonas chengduensis]MDH0956916.1 acyl-CoA synthetase family protein [Pseudomonas chengduensis]MDH1534607.1 acyl-CoA synthetase family protein [Pseudomonas chengduensis]NNB72648.1 AMP-binding protein [Pseudomonas chengduensis]